MQPLTTARLDVACPLVFGIKVLSAFFCEHTDCRDVRAVAAMVLLFASQPLQLQTVTESQWLLLSCILDGSFNGTIWAFSAAISKKERENGNCSVL